MYSWWSGPYRNGDQARWQGRDQVEDKSPANVARCYDFLLLLPYQSAEDRERIEFRRDVEVMKARAARR